MSPRLVPRGPGCAARASATPGCAARASAPAAAVAPVSPFSHACVAMLAHGRDTSCWRDRAGRNKTEPLRRQAKQSTPELCGKTRTETQRGTASNKMERSRVPLPTPAGSVKTVDRAEAESLGQVSGMRGALWTKMCCNVGLGHTLKTETQQIERRKDNDLVTSRWMRIHGLPVQSRPWPVRNCW